jgi:nitrogen fixation protein FixH
MNFHWGHGIFLAFLLFGIMILSLVVGSMQQSIELVSPDYYADEIRYQNRIDAQKNNNTDKNPASLLLKNDTLLLKIAQENAAGNVYFFRPSDSKKDFTMPLSLRDSLQFFKLGHLEKGLWRVKISWSSAGKDYFFEQKIELK